MIYKVYTIDEQKEKVVAFVNEKGNITVKQLLKLLDAQEDEVTGFRIDKNEKPLITEFKGYSKVLKVFKKYNQQEVLEDKSIVDQMILKNYTLNLMMI